ncbi:MAG: protein of unknown function endonuclease [Actinomycetia bacterium]|nr:protein of unknown function endonuclease [Actinomycetes bacterium]
MGSTDGVHTDDTDELTEIADRLDAMTRRLNADACAGPVAAALMVQLGRVGRSRDAMTGPVAKRIEETQAYVVHGDRSAAEFCARMAGVHTSQAKRVIAEARRLESLPETEAAFRAGHLSAQQVALISAVAVHDPSLETELLEHAGDGLVPLRDACIAAQARTEDPQARSARHHAARSFRMWNAADGMVEGRFKLAPEVGAGLKALIDERTREVFRAKHREGVREEHDAYAADALAESVLGSSTGRVATTVHVVIDHAALVRGNTQPGERCDIPGVGPVSQAWVQQQLGTALLTLVVKKGKDITTVAHLGRHVPAEVRTALIVEGRECCVQDCHARGYLEIDHSEVDFAKGGPTAKWNLGFICSPDHTRKSKGWTLGPPDPQTGKRVLAPPGRSAPAIIGTPQPEIGRAARRERVLRLLAPVEVAGEVP